MSQQAAVQFEGSAGEVQVDGERGADLGCGEGVNGGQGDGEPRERGLGTVEQAGQLVGGNWPWDACHIAHGQVAVRVAKDDLLPLEGPERAAQCDGELVSGGAGHLQRLLKMVGGDFAKGRHAGLRPRGEGGPEVGQVAADAFPIARLVLAGALASQHVRPCADLVADELRQCLELPLDPGQNAVPVEPEVIDEQAAGPQNWQTGLAARCVSVSRRARSWTSRSWKAFSTPSQ